MSSSPASFCLNDLLTHSRTGTYSPCGPCCVSASHFSNSESALFMPVSISRETIYGVVAAHICLLLKYEKDPRPTGTISSCRMRSGRECAGHWVLRKQTSDHTGSSTRTGTGGNRLARSLPRSTSPSLCGLLAGHPAPKKVELQERPGTCPAPERRAAPLAHTVREGRAAAGAAAPAGSWPGPVVLLHEFPHGEMAQVRGEKDLSRGEHSSSCTWAGVGLKSCPVGARS